MIVAQSQIVPYYYLSPDSLIKHGEDYTGNNWKYNPGDNPDWANPMFDDSSWETTSSTLNSFESPQNKFTGKGWFRLHLVVDSTLLNKPLSFDLWLAGAAEIFLNGEKVFEYGQIKEDGTVENFIPYFPNIVTFSQKNNLVAVRYFNDKYEEMNSRNFTPGFYLQFASPSYVINTRYDGISSTLNLRSIFITIALVLALLHLFLFLFDRSKKQNFYYVLFLLFFAFFIFINLNTSYGKSVQTLFYLYRIVPFALIFTILFGSTTINSIYRENGRTFIYLLLLGLVLSSVAYFWATVWMWYLVYAYIGGVSVWGSHVLYSSRYSRVSTSDWILRIGFGVMAVMGVLQMLLSLGIIGGLGIRTPYIYGVVVFILSMSIALARDYVSTSKKLAHKLIEVQELSDKTLKQELEAKELDIQKRILEADNKRKTDELESARTVQLAMLPQCLNDIEGLDICFAMRTATEVGGDYYDYKISDDGTMNLVVGDATGHGMKAGIMVASIKSLFSALGMKMMIPDFFKTCTQIIKSMGLGNLFMSMAFIRIKNNTIIGSIAGMPPILVYRKESNTIEEIILKSMPLGAYLDFPYESFQTEFNTGDIVLIMSDGYLELFNSKKQMLGNERLKEYFINYADLSSDDLIARILQKGEDWRKDHPQEDDITFVAIKKK